MNGNDALRFAQPRLILAQRFRDEDIGNSFDDLRISAQAHAPSHIAFAPVCELPQKSIKYLARSLTGAVRKSRISCSPNANCDG
jgi:hypothetical protein